MTIKLNVQQLRRIIAEETQLDRRLAKLKAARASAPPSEPEYNPAERKRVSPPPPMPTRKEPQEAAWAEGELNRLAQRWANSWSEYDLEGEDPITVAQEIADEFFEEVPKAEKLIQATWGETGKGLSPDDVRQMVIDNVYDVLMSGGAVHDVGSMRGSEPKEPKAPRAATPGGEAAPKAAKAAKAAYKIYGKKGGAPAHTRLKGQAYLAPGDTQFKPGEQAAIEPADGKLKVKKADSDHEQLWDPE